MFKHETIIALKNIQSAAEQEVIAAAEIAEQKQKVLEDCNVVFTNLLRIAIQSNSAYIESQQFLRSDLVVAELYGIWEMLKRKKIEKRMQLSILRRILPDRSVLTLDTADIHIQPQSFLPDLELYIQSKPVDNHNVELTKEVANASDRYWESFLYDTPLTHHYNTSKKLSAFTLKIPERHPIFVEIDCVGSFKDMALEKVEFFINSRGLELNAARFSSLDGLIKYLAIYLKNNNVLFTPIDSQIRD